MKTISFTFALTLLVAPAFAQVSGSINRDAPSVTRTIQFKSGATVSTTFTAIRFGKGQWQSILKAKDRHEQFNAGAARRPIGQISCSAPVAASGRTVPAGKYDLFFTVHEQFGWILNLKNKENADAAPVRFGMKMTEAGHKSTRFNIDLTPGDETGTAHITIAFGGQVVSVPMTVGGSPKGKQG